MEGLRRVDPTRTPGWFARAYAALSTTRAAQLISRHVNWKLDLFLLRVTRGRFATTLVFPTAVLETEGARTGMPRRNAVIYFHDGDRVTIVASNAGAPTHPAWFHNLRAHPDLTFGGIPMHATVVEDEAERARLWAFADRVFPAYPRYRHDAAKTGRAIPIVQLTPAGLPGVIDTVETERLVLRPLRADDVDELVALDADPEVMRLITGGRPSTRDQVEARVRAARGYRWMAYARESGGFVGWFSLEPTDGDPRSRELGYRLRRECWGRGLATEGSRALVDAAFEHLDVERIWAQTMTVNVASRRVMEHCGLRFVRSFHGSWPDVIEGAEQGDVEYELRRPT